MASFNLLTLVGLKQKQIVSADSSVDFLSIKIGAIELTSSGSDLDLDGANLVNVGIIDGRDVSTDGTTLDNHVGSTSNPHSVTKTQVGLGNVTNDAQLKAADLDTDGTLAANSDTKIASQKAVKTYVDGQIGGTGSFSDSAFRVVDNGDATKKMAFEVSAITTGTTRTVTMPDAAVNLGLIASAIQSSEKGANSGVATLDSGGKIPAAQLPNSVMEFKGNWNATTNSPTLADGTGNAGDVYRVNVAGSQNLGSGSITFVVGDWAVYNGTIWEKSHAGADAVLSVNGASGVVVLTSDNISEGSTNKYYVVSTARSDIIASAITNGDTTHAPNGDLVFDALALKADASVVSALVVDSIADSDTTHAPSRNAVFDALAGKASLVHTHVAADVTDFDSAARTAVVIDSIADADTTHAPSRNAVFDALALKADASVVSGLVIDSIADADTTHAPSRNAVFDALALKADASSIVTYTASSGIKKVTADFQRDDAKSYTNDNAGSITVRQVVYIKANGNVDKALASTISDNTMLGLVQDATIATTAAGLITIRRGAIVGGFTGLTPGAEQLVSRGTAGALVESLSGFVAGEMVYSVGHAISATEIEFDPQFKFEF